MSLPLSGIPNPAATTQDIVVIPPEAGDPGFDKLFNETLSSLEQEFKYEEPVEEDPQADAQVAPEATKSPETAEKAPEGTPTKPEEKSPTEAGLERLVAREVEVRERERALEAREAALKAREGKKDPTVEQLLQGIKIDPEGALKAVGVNVDHAVRLIIARRMGDKAPGELKQAIRDAEIDQELSNLKAHNTQLRAQAEAAAFYNQKVAEARQYVTGDQLGKDVPGMSELAKESPDWVHEMVIEEITRDAQTRLARGDQSDGLMSPSDALRRIEKWLSPVLGKRTSSTNDTASQGTTSTSQQAATKTTPPNSNQVPPKPPSAPRPLLPWQTKDDGQALLDAGIKEALMEYRRVESGGGTRK